MQGKSRRNISHILYGLNQSRYKNNASILEAVYGIFIICFAPVGVFAAEKRTFRVTVETNRSFTRRSPMHRIWNWLLVKVGGAASLRVVAAFALVLSLYAADYGTIGAMAVYLERAFDISKTELGLLVTLSAIVAASVTVFFGWLVDHAKRTLILTVAVALWGIAMGASALADSYRYLLVTRLASGAAIAATYPSIASLVGDFFPPGRRGRIFGLILAGEMIGTGFGFIIAGELAIISWRLGFLSLVPPAFLVAWLVHRLPEPARDGSSRIMEEGDKKTVLECAASDEGEKPSQEKSASLRRKVREKRIKPRERLVYGQDPQEKSLLWAIGYVLRIPTNLLLIIASALGYYFFAGARTFGVEYIQGQFGLSHVLAVWLLIVLGGGAVIGVLAGGRVGDWLLERGYLPGRVLVTAFAYIGSSAIFLPGFLWPSPWIVLPSFWLASAVLFSVNPPLNAARLDIMHGHLWGRAESIYAVFRTAGEAAAPLLFGYIADRYGGGVPALRIAFLLMLIPLFISGLISLIALRTYPRDVATAEAFTERTCRRSDNRGA